MHNEGFIREGYDVRYMVAERVEDILPMITATARRMPQVEETAVTARM
jgi:hypothetical protein